MKMKFSTSASLRLCGLIFLAALTIAAQNIPAPKDVLGFTPGDDRKLADWAQVVDYFQKLDKASDRVMFQEIGKTTMGAPFVYATISSPDNLKDLEKYKRINAKLADPRTIAGSPPARGGVAAVSADGVVGGRDAEAKRLIAEGKTIVLITCGIHSNEVGSYLSSMLIAYELASSNDADVRKILDNTIILLIPSLNPDGVDIIKNWYDKTLGTPFEGTDPPELYHKYVGHDDNRDWYAFTQVETQLTVDKIHNVWHPQIVNDIHQQGSLGARLFLPPYMQPVEPNVPKQIVEGYTELGNAMAADLRKQGFQGITTDSTYDAWTPSRAYSHYHGGVRILSETASARLATPITVKFEDLRPGLGFDPKTQSPTFGPVWKGGEWHLRDITNYMTAAAFSLLNHAANNREEWLSRFYEIGKEAVRPRKDSELNAMIIDRQESRYDYALTPVLKRAGVEIEETDAARVNGTTYWRGVSIIKMDQPYGAFAKAILESQLYPNLLDKDGHPIPPYDVTAHTFSLLLQIRVIPVSAPLEISKLASGPGVGSGPGFGETRCSENLDFGIFKSDVPSMDEGWTRWTVDRYKFFFKNVGIYSRFCSAREYPVYKKQIMGNLRDEYLKAIVFPDQSPAQILNGYAKGSMPDEYTGGIGKEGVENLKKFVEAGGTLVFLNRSSLFAIEQFNLPIKDVTKGLARKDFYIPGSILRTELDLTSPIAKGMPKESIAWFENGPAFEILSAGSGSVPPAVAGGDLGAGQMAPPPTGGGTDKMEIRVIARYPTDPKQILLSGWALGAEKIAGKAALVEVKMGKGRIILFGFRPQYRGQSLATFPLLFNAISN